MTLSQPRLFANSSLTLYCLYFKFTCPQFHLIFSKQLHSISILKNLIRICLLCLFYSYFHRLDTSMLDFHVSLVFLFISTTMPLLIPSHHSNTYVPFYDFYIVPTAPAGKWVSIGRGCFILRLLIGRPLFLVNSLILFCLYLLHFLYLNSRDFLVSRLLQMLMLLRADGSSWIKIFCSLNLACMLLRSTN